MTWQCKNCKNFKVTQTFASRQNSQNDLKDRRKYCERLNEFMRNLF